MRIRGQSPKLGSLCRWVRDIDAVSGLAEQLDLKPRNEREAELLVVLDSILRLTGPIDYSPLNAPPAGPIIPRDPWDVRGSAKRRKTYDTVLDKTILQHCTVEIKSGFSIIEQTPGPDRKPPNLHPATLHASRDDTIALSPSHVKPQHHMHPIVPHLHLFQDVLSPDECTQIIAAGETIGFEPDAPVREVGEESSILAHNFYWLVDTAFCNKLWSRVEEFVPTTVAGKQVRGLNRRFRVYRYVPGAEYRAHIGKLCHFFERFHTYNSSDGAWPPSGTCPVSNNYIYDSSPPDAKQSSLFTFLIYLNDDFNAGETTFFLPSAREGSMNAYSVKPIQGSILMFPHGETEGSLLHEGTGVKRDDHPTAKYVIRTDVLYDINAKT